ncbi:MAG: glutamate--cysteine ligase [Gammaproteobacteria bacterium]|nr:glutamate--cysteine ligase [Gammaproteobacteria bacterium]
MSLKFELDKVSLNLLALPANARYFAGITRGVERESLRVNEDTAALSQKDHPQALGSALTHPSITTDFSEALIELVTPPVKSLAELEQSLDSLHRFSYHHLDHELLWPASMPGLIEDQNDIRLAHFGCSNIAKMKNIYRRGLCHRYGRMMQVIAGIHYNFSLPTELFAAWHASSSTTESLREFTDAAYFKLMRNYFRHYWLLIYLFGASPVCSASSLPAKVPDYLEPLDEHNYYAPYGTSLRMSDLGYNNSSQASIWISRDNIAAYVKDLLAATNEPYPDYAKIGLRNEQGEYRQLNTNLLQIENEYYSPIRPKQVIRSGERPALALQDRGVEYIEVRCLDVNPFSPVGIDIEAAAFIDVFLVFCLLADSTKLSKTECAEKTHNLHKIILEGRRPDLSLEHLGKTVPMREWADSLFTEFHKIAAIMDSGVDKPVFVKAVQTQYGKIIDSSQTPSAQILALLNDKQQSYQQAMLDIARQYAADFTKKPLSASLQQKLSQQAAQSWIEQQKIEQGDALSFEQFLEQYFAQH